MSYCGYCVWLRLATISPYERPEANGRMFLSRSFLLVLTFPTSTYSYIRKYKSHVYERIQPFGKNQLCVHILAESQDLKTLESRSELTTLPQITKLAACFFFFY